MLSTSEIGLGRISAYSFRTQVGMQSGSHAIEGLRALGLWNVDKGVVMFACRVSNETGGGSASRSISLRAQNYFIGSRKASLIKFANSVGRRLSVFSI